MLLYKLQMQENTYSFYYIRKNTECISVSFQEYYYVLAQRGVAYLNLDIAVYGKYSVRKKLFAICAFLMHGEKYGFSYICPPSKLLCPPSKLNLPIAKNCTPSKLSCPQKNRHYMIITNRQFRLKYVQNWLTPSWKPHSSTYRMGNISVLSRKWSIFKLV